MFLTMMMNQMITSNRKEVFESDEPTENYHQLYQICADNLASVSPCYSFTAHLLSGEAPSVFPAGSDYPTVHYLPSTTQWTDKMNEI